MGQRTKRGKYKFALLSLLIIAAAVALTAYLRGHSVPVLQPGGQVGQKEKHLIIISVLLSALVVVPVFIMTAVIAYRYREGNSAAKYTPDWDRSRAYETIWWGIPIIIIGILSVITWNSAHALDPYKPLSSATPPLTIQVVALDWKWLFIYPKQNIATVNFAQFPINTPVDFEITSDSVMNSFWVPQLGGQIYAMTGMATHLNLMASQTGSFSGSSANISGSGFAGMTFTARSSSFADFNTWVQQVGHSPNKLNETAYNSLAKPSKYNSPAYYSSPQTGMFEAIMLKYLLPASQIPPFGSRPYAPIPNLHGAGM